MNAKEFTNLVTPKVNTLRGAQMGRSNINNLPKTLVLGFERYTPVKTSTRRIQLNIQGYDKGGAYWGLGRPLFANYSKCGNFIEYFREN